MKKLNHYEAKSVKEDGQVLENRQVKFYASVFNVKDSDNDIIRKGAYAKSISERGVDSESNRKIGYLRNHNWDKSIGKILSMEEDGYGLLVTAQLGRATDGKDALLDYQDGIIREHSIGFNYIPDKMNLVETDNEFYYDITEVKLFEVSAVTFGANEFTHVVDVAKGNKESEIDKLNKEMNSISEALKSGKFDTYNLEMKLKILQTKYNSLINIEPKKITQIEKPNIKQIYINLLKK